MFELYLYDRICHRLIQISTYVILIINKLRYQLLFASGVYNKPLAKNNYIFYINDSP